MASTTGARSRKRTAKQAIQSDRADIAATQKARGQRTRQYRKEAGSYRGATNMAVNFIRQQNLGGLRGTPEGNQIAKEYSGRIKSLQQSLPFALAPVQREFKSDIQGINSDLAGAQLDLQQHRQDKLAAIQDILAAQRDEAQKIAENKAGKRSGVDAAYKEALRLIREQALINKDPNASEGDKRPSALPRNELEWMQFEDSLGGRAGIDERAARKAVQALKRRLGAVPTSRRPHSKFEDRFQLPQVG